MANTPNSTIGVQLDSVRNRLATIVVALAGLGAYAQNLPTLPRASFDTSYPTMSGNTIPVSGDGDFQNALNTAQPGDTIQLAAGATFTGQFTLPAKNGNGWIVVRTSAPDSSLPPQGSRIDPSYASVLPKIVSMDSTPALRTDPAAHHYRIVGVEVTLDAS